MSRRGVLVWSASAATRVEDVDVLTAVPLLLAVFNLILPAALSPVTSAGKYLS